MRTLLVNAFDIEYKYALFLFTPESSIRVIIDARRLFGFRLGLRASLSCWIYTRVMMLLWARREIWIA